MLGIIGKNPILSGQIMMKVLNITNFDISNFFLENPMVS